MRTIQEDEYVDVTGDSLSRNLNGHSSPQYLANLGAGAEGASERNVEVADEIFAGLPLSEDGKDWLKAVTDPFHDKRFNYNGYPGPDQPHSTISAVVRKQTTISKPTWLAAEATWDCQVALTSTNMGTYFETEEFFANIAQATYPNTGSEGGTITISCTAEGGDHYPNPITNTVPESSGVGQTVEYHQLSPVTISRAVNPATGYLKDADYLDGMARLEGGGIEAHVVSSVTKRGGTVTVGERNSSLEKDTYFFSGGAGPIQVWGNAYTDQSPCYNVSQIANLPDTDTWDAREGAYVVFKPQEEDMKWQHPKPTNIVACTREISAGTAWAQSGGTNDYTAINLAWGDNFTGLPDVATGSNCPPALTVNRFSKPYIFFTGLDPGATLTIIAKFLITRAPSPDDSLVSYCNPPPEFDPLAWPIYSEIRNRMPPGVPVRENFLGTWVSKVANEVEKVVKSDFGQTGLALAEQHGGPKARIAATAARTHYADDLDEVAAEAQHKAAKVREAQGVPPSRAGTGPGRDGRVKKRGRRNRREIRYTNRTRRRRRRGRQR